MKKDIIETISKGVHIAIIPTDDELWEVFILNENNFPLDTVLINSKGFGQREGEKIETSTIRQHIKTLDKNSFQKIENISSDVFDLNNRYWVTYYIENTIYDKKFLFTPFSIDSKNLTPIEILDKKGIYHK